MLAKVSLLALPLSMSVAAICMAQEGWRGHGEGPNMVKDASASLSAKDFTLTDLVDPIYKSKIRQITYSGGHIHNLYYYRNPWNADGTRLLGIVCDPQQKNWRVVLLDGDGHFIKELFSIDKYDWRLCWDRTDPDILYTWKGAKLFRFNVSTAKADLLKSFEPLWLKPNGPSVNQTGDRILVITSDDTFRSYRLPDMTEEHAFQLTVPPGCNVDWGKPRYIGYRNYIDTAYTAPGLTEQAIVVYDDTGKIVHKFEGIGGGGHYDFSPDGHLAYFKLPRSPRSPGGESPLEIHTVKLDGSQDKVLFSVPRDKAVYVQNLHLSWPSKVNDWFIASLFPTAGNLPPSYEPLLDEILMIHTNGTHRYLARTQTVYSRTKRRGSSGDMFWAQPLARPSADGKRVCFNSNRSGSIALYILYVDVH